MSNTQKCQLSLYSCREFQPKELLNYQESRPYSAPLIQVNYVRPILQDIDVNKMEITCPYKQ